MTHSWLLRPSPGYTNRMSEFLSENFIAIGWSETGDLAGQSRGQLKVTLSQKPHFLTSLELGSAYATVDIFVNQMKPDDLVLVANGDDIHFCIIKSDYMFDPSAVQFGYSHQRKVAWLATTQRKNLPMNLRMSLKVHRTAADLGEHYEIIKALAFGNSIPVALTASSGISMVKVDYPLRPDLLITVSVPSDITQSESDRLGNFIKTLFFE